jgi:hypothetical protein
VITVLQIARILVALAALATVHEASAQTKKDILGFYPGMTKSEFDKQLVEMSKGDCTPFWNSGSCSLKSGKLIFSFTKENLLQDVIYKFVSGTEPEEIVNQITSEYKAKLRPGDVKQAIGKARIGQWVAMGSRTVLLRSARIAEWELSSKDILFLELETVSGNEFRLFLMKPKFIEAHKAELQKAKDDKERERRSVNPKPKF